MSEETTEKTEQLYPELNDRGKKAAQQIIDGFKKQLAKAADDAIKELYTDVAEYIEFDCWHNFRDSIVKGMSNFRVLKEDAPYDFDQIRERIFKDHKDELLPLLNQDLVKKNADLESHVEILRGHLDRRGL